MLLELFSLLFLCSLIFQVQLKVSLFYFYVDVERGYSLDFGCGFFICECRISGLKSIPRDAKIEKEFVIGENTGVELCYRVTYLVRPLNETLANAVSSRYGRTEQLGAGAYQTLYEMVRAERRDVFVRTMGFLLRSVTRRLHLISNKKLFTDPIELARLVANQRCRIYHGITKTPKNLCTMLQDFIDSSVPSNGLVLHSFILKAGLQRGGVLCTKLLILYVKSGCLDYARQVFDEMRQKTVSSWNTMIAAYFKQGQFDKSLRLVCQMQGSVEVFDGFTYSCILRLSASLRNLGLGRQVHCQILRHKLNCDHVLTTGLIDMYAKNGKIEYAHRLFYETPEKNLICSTAMISGYMKCGRVEDAEQLFNAMFERDVVVWNAMIEGYSLQPENAIRALCTFIEMQRAGICPTVSTFASIIGACISLSALEQGQQAHAHVIKSDLCVDVRSGSALVDMYAKCGRIEDSRKVFDTMRHRNVITWTSMIDGYGKNGNVDESLQLFQNMKMSKVSPNYVTFLSVLSACGHGGLVDEGWEIFNSMARDFKLSPKLEHYACMVDLIGRAGSLHEALEFIGAMPIEPNEDVWGALLGASRLHGDVNMAAVVAKELFKLNSCRPGAYVALSNAYAAAGRWEGVRNVRELMKESGVSKNAACSWVETGKGLQAFHVE